MTYLTNFINMKWLLCYISTWLVLIFYVYMLDKTKSRTPFFWAFRIALQERYKNNDHNFSILSNSDIVYS